MKSSIISIGSLVLGLSTPGFALDRSSFIKANPLPSPPTIDGILGEWKDLEPITGFYTLDEQPAKEDSKVWISYDHDHLYVAAFNPLDPRREKDTFSVYLNTSPLDNRVYRFSVSTTDDSPEVLGEKMTPLDCGRSFNHARKITREGWGAEIAIPLTQLEYQTSSHFDVIFVRDNGKEPLVWPKMHTLDLSGAARITELYIPQRTKPEVSPIIIAKVEDTSREYGLSLRKVLDTTPFSDTPSITLDVAYSYAETVNSSSPFSVYGERVFPYTMTYPTTGDLSFETRAQGTLGRTHFILTNDLILGGRNDLGAHVGHSLGDQFVVNSGVSRRREGDLENTVTQAGIEFRQRVKKGTVLSRGTVTHTNLDENDGNFIEVGLRYIPNGAQPKAYLTYTSITEQYHPLAGYVPETNIEGFNLGLDYTLPRTKAIESMNILATGETFDRLDGTFLRYAGRIGSTVNLNGLPEVTVAYSQGENQDSHDHLFTSFLGWGLTSSRGTLGFANGTLYGQPYHTLSLSQDITPFSGLQLSGRTDYSVLDHTPTQQYTGGFTYRGISGRLVSNTEWTNGYLSYAKRFGEGLTLSTLLGDPYATEFTLGGSVTLMKKFN